MLVIDEAQDLSHQHALDFFNLAICGGLAGGRWVMFGDFTRQALYGVTDDPVHTLSYYCEHFVRAKLTLNCRNTRRIAKETTILAGFESPPFRLGEEAGLPVDHRYWKAPSDLMESLTHTLESLVKERIPVDNIMLLSPLRLENSSLAGVDRILGFPVIDAAHGMTSVRLDALKFSTIHSFKGLESQVVIIVDIEAVDGEQSQSLLYVAMSRARSLLILMINERSRNAVESRIRRAMQQEFSHEVMSSKHVTS